jgi:hypothetical protein
MTKLGHFLEARLDRVRPEALLRVGLSPAAKVLDLKGRLRCRVREEGAGGGFGEVAGAGRIAARDARAGSRSPSARFPLGPPAPRGRNGAGWGEHSRRRSLLGLVRPAGS